MDQTDAGETHWNPPQRKRLSHGQRRPVYKDSVRLYLLVTMAADVTTPTSSDLVREHLTVYGQGFRPKGVGYFKTFLLTKHQLRDASTRMMNQINRL